jgi:hypothetical protein
MSTAGEANALNHALFHTASLTAIAFARQPACNRLIKGCDRIKLLLPQLTILLLC